MLGLEHPESNKKKSMRSFLDNNDSLLHYNDNNSNSSQKSLDCFKVGALS